MTQKQTAHKLQKCLFSCSVKAALSHQFHAVQRKANGHTSQLRMKTDCIACPLTTAESLSRKRARLERS